MSVYRVGSNKSSVNNFPKIRPTLDLDFANSKTLDPRIDFTRASGGSYVGADSLIKYASVNEPRFDHDPVTGESLGLLIEERRTNLVTNSNTYTLASNANITIDNSITSPDGKNGVQKVQSNITSGSFFSRSNNIISDNSTRAYTWSVFIKQGSPLTSNVNVQFGFTNTATVFYNFNTDTVTNFSADSFGRDLYPNGWVRLYGTTRIPTGNTFNLIIVVQSAENAGGINAYFYQWGAQIEQGNNIQSSFPTSYIPTQGSTRTRQPDNVQISGSNFSSWYKQDEGTVFCEAKGIDSIFIQPRRYYEFILEINNNFRMTSGYSNSTTTRFLVVNNGLLQADLLQTNQVPFKNNVKTATSFSTNYFRFYSNGLSADVDNFGSVPIVDRLFIGRPGVFNSVFFLNGTVKRFTYYPKSFPDSQLIALTR